MENIEIRTKSISSNLQDGRPTLGLFIHDVVQPEQGLLWRGVADAAQKQGANLICFPGGHVADPGFEGQRNILYSLISAEWLNGLMGWDLGVFTDLEDFYNRYHPLPVINLETKRPNTSDESPLYEMGQQAVAMTLARVRGQEAPEDGDYASLEQAQTALEANVLREVGQTLAASVDLEDLLEGLARELPRLGIPAAYLALYDPSEPGESSQAAPAQSRLVFAYDEQGRRELEKGGQAFPSAQLLPAGLLNRQAPYHFIVEPLYFQRKQLGFVVFEVGPREGEIYETLREQMSSAVQSALLVEEVRERSAELAQEKFLLNTLMDNVPDYIYFKDTASRFIRTTRAHARAAGLNDPAQAVGKSDFDFYTEEHARPAYEDEQRIIRTGTPLVGVEEKETWPDRPDTWVLTTKMPLRNENGVIIGTFGITHDITEIKQARAALEKAYTEVEQQVQERTAQLKQLNAELDQRVVARTQRLETIANLSGELNAILDVDQLLDELVDQVKEQFDYYHAQIYLLDDERRHLVLKAGYGKAGDRMKSRGYRFSVDVPVGLVARSVRERISLLVKDVRAEPSWKSNPLLPDTQAELVVPIIVEGEVAGVLDVQSDKVDGLDEGDVSMLRSLANQVGVAMTNARLFEEVRQRALELSKAKENVEAANQTLTIQMWQTTGQALLNEKMRGEQDIPTLARNIIQQLCKYLNAQVGALYTMEGEVLRLVGSYAYTRRKNLSNQFQLGESLVGQAALEKQPIIITNVPNDYVAITSGLGETPPRNILVAPFVYDGEVAGVVELGTLSELTPAQMEFLEKALESIAIAFTTAQARRRVNELLTQTRQQAAELQVQEEELRAANEELEAQTESLRASEAKLKANQEQLEAANAELEEKADALEKNSAVLQEQRAALDRQNQALKTAQQELEQKAEELALASKYKSEFLANMSHELRTPLNSLLILASMLAKNEPGNLTPDQVESAQIIHSGGSDLLNLINDILDLSKVEAGKVEFRFAPMPLERLVGIMRAQFNHVAEDKGLEFQISLAHNLPETIETDQQRVEQIIKNLLSNAFKFTEKGRVSLDIYRPQPDVDLRKSGLDPARTIVMSVTDTGIGMTPEQQKIVFEAFQQADGSTSRQYGGTGLGLSISRELATRLGGQIDLVSEKGRGSTFTLYLPIERGGERRGDQEARRRGEERRGSEETRRRGEADDSSPHVSSPLLPDDRAELQPGDRVLLTIEDDSKFARVVYDYAHRKGFKCLLAGDGEAGLNLAKTHHADAIILDLNLPGMSGWEVLDRLKNDPNTRHIPVHIMSVADEDLDAYKRGAMGFLTKPVSEEDLDVSFQKIEQFIARKIKTLLLVEDDAHLRKSVKKLLEGNDITISEASRGQAALEQLAAQHFDCMILDLNLPDMNGFELLNRLDADESLSKCPVIVYTGRALTEEENRELLKYADSVIVKGVKSPERLLDETALFLHRVIANLPEEKQRTIQRLHDSEALLANKSILIVDDDARNAFALSKLLADKGLRVNIAAGGQKALELLDKIPVDLVLLDIMMPGMDGYEVTQRIRAQQQFRTLPILALTAKAMKGDREKCLAAGASDYLSKPVDPDRLFSLLRVWLSRE